MEKSNPSNRICRTCLKSSPTMVPLFNDTSLCRKILAISSVVVSPGGNLPTVVCVKCLLNINSAFKFRQVLINSDARLKAAIIKNAKRRLHMQDTTDPLDLSSQDNKNELSPKQASIINLEYDDLIPVTSFTLDFNPFREEPLQNNNIRAVAKHPSPNARNSSSDSSAMLPGNLTKFQDPVLKKLSPVNCNSYREEGGGTVKIKAAVALPEERQPMSTVNKPSINTALKRKLSSGNLNSHIEEGGGTIKTEVNVALPETNQPASPVNTSRAKQSNVLVKDLLCQVCGKLFDKSNFSRHVLNHTEVPVDCKVCGKAVKNIYNIRYHMQMHSSAVTTCEYCGKTFKHRSSHLDHLNSHTGNKKHKCHICDNKFSRSDTLKKHMQTHTGERPYPCKYCNKGFTSSYALKTHIRQHTNEKPYTCDHCSMGFHQKVSLTTHLKSKHNKVITS